MPEQATQPAQEAPIQRDQVVKAALRTVKPHQLQEEGEARFFVGRGKKREEIALSHAEIKKMMVEQEIDKLVARRSRLYVESRKGGDVTPEEQQDVIALAESMQEEVKAVRGAVDGKKRSEKVLTELDKRGVLTKRREAYLADDTLRGKAEQAVQRKIGASERGILGNKIATRYKETAEQYPQAAQLQGTPKERLQQLLSSDLINDAQKQALREQLSAGLQGYDGNAQVDTFNNRLQQEWNPQNTQTEAEVVSGQEALITASTESVSAQNESAQDQPAEKTEGNEVTANSSWHDAIENLITTMDSNGEVTLANEDTLLEELPKYMGKLNIPLEQGVAYVQERFGVEGVAKLFDSIGTYRDGLSRYDEDEDRFSNRVRENQQILADYWLTEKVPGLREKLDIPEPETEGKEIPPVSPEQWQQHIDKVLTLYARDLDRESIRKNLPAAMLNAHIPLEVGVAYFKNKFGVNQVNMFLVEVQQYRDHLANLVTREYKAGKGVDPRIPVVQKAGEIVMAKQLDDWVRKDIPGIREELGISQSNISEVPEGERERQYEHPLDAIDDVLFDVANGDFADNPALKEVVRKMALEIRADAGRWDADFRDKVANGVMERPGVSPTFFANSMENLSEYDSNRVAAAIATRLGILSGEEQTLKDLEASGGWEKKGGSKAGAVAVLINGEVGNKVLEGRDDPDRDNAPIVYIGKTYFGSTNPGEPGKWSFSVHVPQRVFNTFMDKPLNESRFLNTDVRLQAKNAVVSPTETVAQEAEAEAPVESPVAEQPEASPTQEEPVEAATEQTQDEVDQVQQEVPLQLDDEPGVAIPPPPSSEPEPEAITTEPELVGVGVASSQPPKGRSFFSRIFGR